MQLHKRIDVANRLIKQGKIKIGDDYAINTGGLVRIVTDKQLIHPFTKTELENPMTWDTFTHLYLLDKEE